MKIRIGSTMSEINEGTASKYVYHLLKNKVDDLEHTIDTESHLNDIRALTRVLEMIEQ